MTQNSSCELMRKRLNWIRSKAQLTKLKELPHATSTTLASPFRRIATSCCFLMSFTGFAAINNDPKQDHSQHCENAYWWWIVHATRIIYRRGLGWTISCPLCPCNSPSPTHPIENRIKAKILITRTWRYAISFPMKVCSYYKKIALKTKVFIMIIKRTPAVVTAMVWPSPQAMPITVSFAKL